MKLSVALCTYNGQAYLQDQFASLLAQDRLPTEVVISDDASTDDTLSLVDAFAKQAPFPVYVLVNQSNIGTAYNFSRAIAACSGDIIALCDQDDVWLPQKLDLIMQAFSSNPQIGYAFSDAIVVDQHLQSFSDAEASLWHSVAFTPEDIDSFTLGDCVWQVQRLLQRTLVTGTTMAFRSSLRHLVLPVSPTWVHDAWIALVLSAFGCVGMPIKQPLVKYRQHQSQQLGVRSGLAIHSPQVSNITKFDIFRKMPKDTKLTKRFESLEAMQVLSQHLISCQQARNEAISDRVMTVIQSHTQHLRSRILAYESNGLQRWAIILRSLISGGYHIHSNRYASVIKDTMC